MGEGDCPLTQKLQTTEQDCLSHWAGLSLDTFSCPLPPAWAMRSSQLLPGPDVGLPDLLSPPPHPLPPPPGPLAPSHTSYLFSSSRSLREAGAPFPNPSGRPQRGNEFEGRAASPAHTAQHTPGIVLHAHTPGRMPACTSSRGPTAGLWGKGEHPRPGMRCGNAQPSRRHAQLAPRHQGWGWAQLQKTGSGSGLRGRTGLTRHTCSSPSTARSCRAVCLTVLLLLLYRYFI